MSRIPIVNLAKGISFGISTTFKAFFYYLPMWMLGNKWCDSCTKIIKRHEPLYPHSTQAEDFCLCQECEDAE